MNTIFLALGDSITTGYGLGTNQSFATLFYKNLLSYNPSLQYVNLGVNGLTSEELAAMVGQIICILMLWGITLWQTFS